VFTELDRASGNEVDMFYLRTGGKKAIKEFNTRFLTKFGIEDESSLPCVAFFKIERGNVTDVNIAVLKTPSTMLGASELKDLIESYIADGKKSEKWTWLSRLGTVGEKLGVPAFVALVTEAFKHFLK
jgi:hypothetical protein